MGYGHNNASSAQNYPQQHQQQQQSYNNGGSSGPPQNPPGGYDAMAAQIINSFGGSQLSPNLISPDLSKSGSNNEVSKEKEVVHQPRGPSVGGDLTPTNGKPPPVDLSQLQSFPPKAASPLKRAAEDIVDEAENVGKKAKNDPYNFDDDEEKPAKNAEFSRFQKSGASSPAVYKFKSALLSRENRTSSTESRSSASSVVNNLKGIPVNFDKSSQMFIEACDGFIDDLQNKTVSISKRPSLETYRERLEARKLKNAGRGRKKKSDLGEDAVKTEDGGEKSETEPSPKKETPKKEKKKKEKKSPEKEKKSPGRKKKDEKDNNNTSAKPNKKGGLWALPIVPKPPQKPSDKQQRRDSPAPMIKDPKDVDLCDVWRQAFGGSKSKDAKIKQENENLDLLPLKKGQKRYLDIPPETRRKPRPNFGGLIHFAPDWQASVKKHHVKCRIPPKVADEMNSVKPKILSSNASDSKPLVSSPNTSGSDLEDTLVPGNSKITDMNSVEKIIKRRKMRMKGDRSYRKPPTMKKKVTFDTLPEEGMGMLATPGLPLLTQDTKDDLMNATNFGNFRRQTLLRYLEKMDDSAELKAKILDWKPEVLETKTRRQSNQVKAVTSYKEIFGIDLPTHKPSRPGASSEFETPKGTPKKKKKKVEEIKTESGENDEFKTPEKVPKTPKSTPKKEKVSKKKSKKEKELEAKEEKVVPKEEIVEEVPKKEEKVEEEEVEEEYIPTEEDEKLQTDLQSFALELLDSNLSWANRQVIQNLVIWEPVDGAQPVINPSKKYKKYKKTTKKRKSGLDLAHTSKKKSKSRDISRAGSPEPEEVHKIKYSLDEVIFEAKNWVTDKASGETILHRAAKYGFPDIVAYALDMAKMSPTVKDNAGIPPIHKAAFKGHAEVVEILLKFGVDPNTNVKGTRPLHEALEGGFVKAVNKVIYFFQKQEKKAFKFCGWINFYSIGWLETDLEMINIKHWVGEKKSSTYYLIKVSISSPLSVIYQIHVEL